VNDTGRLDWDDGNENHVLRHGVEPYEVEEAFRIAAGLVSRLTARPMRVGERW
jgi:hypothetical protein